MRGHHWHWSNRPIFTSCRWSKCSYTRASTIIYIYIYSL